MYSAIAIDIGDLQLDVGIRPDGNTRANINLPVGRKLNWDELKRL